MVHHPPGALMQKFIHSKKKGLTLEQKSLNCSLSNNLSISTTDSFLSVLCPIIRFIYETEHFNGVAELLEILGRFVFSIMQTRFKAHKHMLLHCSGEESSHSIRVKQVYMRGTFLSNKAIRGASHEAQTQSENSGRNRDEKRKSYMQIWICFTAFI